MCCTVLLYTELSTNEVWENCTCLKFYQALLTISDIAPPVAMSLILLTEPYCSPAHISICHCQIGGDSTHLGQATDYLFMSSSVGMPLHLHTDTFLL